jgi:putative ABC transport system substrate-binding protein
VNRRDFIRVAGTAAIARSLAARAQQPERMRRIGVLSYLASDDPESKLYASAFVQGLQELGWVVGRNVQIDFRWTGGGAERIRQYVAELVALSPDILLVAGGSHVGPVQQATRSVPIVFVQVTDPVGGGFVSSLARPGGNTTGFTVFEFDISAKWLELLKQIAPRTTRVGILRDPANPSGTGLFGAMQAVAPTFGVEVSPIGLHDAGEIERGVVSFASAANGGLVVTPSGLAIVNRGVIIKAAAQNRLPAIYPFRDFAIGGGLLSYGPDVADQYRRAAGYVDRILKGEKPADLPVQRSTKLELVVNLKTAKALGVDVPQSIMLRADEAIR